MLRRRTNPSILQLIWDAIKTLENEHEYTDLPAIAKYLQKEAGFTMEQTEVYINHALSDQLILENKKIVNKGLKPGTLIESYKTPYQESVKPINDGYDWYCMECHLGGIVQKCSNCYRVFHTECLKKRNSLTNNNLKFLNDKNGFTNQLKEICIVDPVTAFNESGTIPDIFNINPQNSGLGTNIGSENLDLMSPASPEININGKEAYDERLCSVCTISKAEDTCPLTREGLNYLLGFILERIKSWLPLNLTHKMDPKQQQEQWNNTELEWRANQLWFARTDMNQLYFKVKSNHYTTLSEFQADVMLIRHNVAIFHGFESQENTTAGLMLGDCCHELSELCVCADCYRHSNEKINASWFCLPCKYPHRLVWAKQLGYPYWPAKIIRETDSAYDVRFFGGKYERSLLPKSSCKPVGSSPKKFQMKQHPSFKKALDELRLHQTLLKDDSAVQKLINDARKQKAEKKRRRSSVSGKSPSKKTLQVKQDIYEFPDGHENLTPTTPPEKWKSLSPTNKSIKTQKTQQEIDIVSIPDEKMSTIRVLDVGCTETTVDQVTSSTEGIIGSEDSAETQMQELEKPYSDAIEKMRRKLEVTEDKNELIITAMNSMMEEIDRIQAEHAEQLKKLIDDHAIQISETKRKQWCYNCQQDAIYHCCWNTAYCSQVCQQQHWQAEHKKVCRRKR